MKTTILKKEELVIAFLIIILTMVVYWPVTHFDFINEDDLYVVENSYVLNGLSLQSILWSFTSIHGHWHPLTWLSHLADVTIFGMNPGSHHLINLLLHITNSLLLFIVFKKLTGDIYKSGFIAVFFALHPLNVESVAWIMERKNLLFAFFWILTMQSYLRYSEKPHIKRYVPIVFWYMLSLMSKPMAVTLPCVLLLLDYWPLNRFDFNSYSSYYQQRKCESANIGNRRNGLLQTSALRLIFEKVPLFILSVGTCTVTFIAQKSGGSVMSLSMLPLSARITNALVSYMQYIEKMFWPVNQLAIFYPHPGQPSFINFFSACVLFAFIFYITIKARKQHPYLIVGWLWYLGTLVPVIGLVQVGSQSMADRYAYTPLIGLFIMIAWGIPIFLKQYNLKKQWSGSILALILLLTAWTTSLQVNYWKDEITLFQHAVNVTTDNEFAHYNLGMALSEQGRYLEAIHHHSAVLNLKPNNVNALNNLGIDLVNLGRIDEAINQYAKAINFNPKYMTTFVNMGNALIKKGKVDEAIVCLLKASESEPNNSIAHNSLGVALFYKGDINKAVIYFQKALRLDPGYVNASNNLKAALALLPK